MKPVKKKRTTFSIIIPFIIIALVFALLVWKKYRASLPQPQVPQVQQPAVAQSAILFFVADGSRLGREAREIEPCKDTSECIRDILEELFSGPVGDLNDALPEGALLNSVLIEGDKVTVDVNSNFVSEMPSGSSAEMMAVYSIVNTVCVNFPQIKNVKLNIDGESKVALKHLDLADPIPADYSLEQKPELKPEKTVVPKKQ
jgi:spore germination protein GerM